MKTKNCMSIEEYRKAKHSHAETIIPDTTWQIFELPIPVRNYRFCERRWAFDYAWPEKKIAVEIEGGFFNSGRSVICDKCKLPVYAIDRRGKRYTVKLSGAHAGARYLSDMHKYNNAASAGWIVLRYLPTEVNYIEIKDVWLANPNK